MIKKIIVLGSLASSLVNFRYQLLLDLQKNGFIVVACAPDIDNAVISKLREINVEYINVPLNRTGMNPFYDIVNLFKMRAIFKEIKADFIISYTIKPVIYGSIAAKFSGIENIYSMITGLGYSFSNNHGLKGKIVNVIVRALFKISLLFNKKVFFQNPDDISVFQENSLLRNNDQAVLINGSGVNLNYYQHSSLPHECSFLLIARLIKEKGVVEYAEAAKKVKKQYPNTRFYLAGWIDTNPASIKKSLLDQWINDGTINYLGKLSDVRPAIANCSVYVLPSYREGTPRTVLEAMAMGRAIITTDAPGCRETVVDGENGYLVPVKSVDLLAEKMIKLIINPDKVKKMANKSYEIAKYKYEVHKVNDTIIQQLN
ncbi:MAG: glycosyltransferase family 4 protein [Emcibacteraceae bacterium]|nr:glycosyltransferase family 4 protein [Emcibacteraceae bacterium]